jgi:transposase
MLAAWAGRRKTAQATALRSRIVLACAEGLSNGEVAARCGANIATVRKWRSRFVEHRLDGLGDDPRPGKPRTITDAQVTQMVTDTLESVPANATHWSRTSMARRSGLSESTVGRIWKAFNLKPHRADTFKLSTDPEFVAKLRDVVGLYLRPPLHAAVFCVDEKTQVQALDRSQAVLPMMPGMPEKRSHDYHRHGVTSLFAALNIATGQVITSIHRRHRHQEFLKFLKTVDANTPADLDLHLILDNYGTHKTPRVREWLAAHPRFHLHFIPTSSSWCNLVERWFGEVTTKMLQRGVHRSVQALEKALRSWIAQWNDDPKPFVWTKTADEILESLGRYCHRITGGGH